MKKIVFLAFIAVFCALLALTAFAAGSPVIDEHPSAEPIVEGETAVWHAKAHTAAGVPIDYDYVWFIEYDGVIYNMSDVNGTEPIFSLGDTETGLGIGPMENSLIFTGIMPEMDGAYVWFRAYDGDVFTESSHVRVTVTRHYTIELVSAPNKVRYKVGETVDLKGLKVRIWASDGFFDSVDGKDLDYVLNPLKTPGEQKFRISYGDAIEFFIITVDGEAVTTAAVTTAVPTTQVPTTAVPTTVAPTTAVPTTALPSTEIPTTKNPVTEKPVVDDPIVTTAEKTPAKDDKKEPNVPVIVVCSAAAGAAIGVGAAIFVRKKKIK